MKVKQRLEDFRVEEVSRLQAAAEGEFALYRLEKSGLGTPEALRLVARAWRLSGAALACAGLKDRYGVTGQTISVRRGPRSNLSGRGFKLNYLGRADRPAARGTILENQFRLRLRDLGPGEAERVTVRAREAAVHGIPNYYDDQRFGSLRGTGGRFVARALMEGDPERALRLAIASPDRADRSGVKRRRKLLKDRWGHWPLLVEQLDPSREQRICARLAQGASFAEAYAMLDRALRDLHLSAFQAHLFNACLRRAVGREGPRHPGVDGDYLFHRGERRDLAELRFPLASGAAPREPQLDAVLEGEFLDRTELARLDFRPGERDALVVPRALEAAAPEADELNAGRRSVRLAFALPPGSYATMLIKRCTWDVD